MARDVLPGHRCVRSFKILPYKEINEAGQENNTVIPSSASAGNLQGQKAVHSSADFILTLYGLLLFQNVDLSHKAVITNLIHLSKPKNSFSPSLSPGSTSVSLWNNRLIHVFYNCMYIIS